MLVCGADALAGDRLCCMNLSLQSYQVFGACNPSARVAQKGVGDRGRGVMVGGDGVRGSHSAGLHCGLECTEGLHSHAAPLDNGKGPQLLEPACLRGQPTPRFQAYSVGVIKPKMLALTIPLENHLEETLLDQTQPQAPYIPAVGGIRVA